MGEPGAKSAADENFPVGSLLIERRLRGTVMAYYAVARATDDIADDPALPPDEKLRRLDRFEAALEARTDGPDVIAATLAGRALSAAGVPIEHATRLLRAFRQDAVKQRYDDWDDLMAYCADSAAPVGRFLLDLHGENRSGYRESDALCTALQVINHLQDCRDDYRTLGRIYLPANWLATEGVTIEDLDSTACGPGMRRVIDRCLDGVDALLAEARPLPLRLRSTRLALETAVILALAEALSRCLRVRDPLAEHVRLARFPMLMRGVAAALACLAGRMRGARAGARRRPA